MARKGRPYVFPNPNDMSANDPAMIVSSKQVLGIYTQETGETARYVTDTVKEWFIDEAVNHWEWDVAKFIGNQCLLENTKIQKP